MSRRGPKVRQSRRVGVALTPKAARYFSRRPYPPGVHGARRQRASLYRDQLIEKQRLRFAYDVSERQMKTLFAEAKRLPGVTGEVLVSLLERRVDALVLHAGFARTIHQARQFVSHGHVEVGGRRVDRRGYRLEAGQTLAIRPGSRDLPCMPQAGELHSAPPGYLAVDPQALSARLLAPPQRAEIPVVRQERLVVEFYNR